MACICTQAVLDSATYRRRIEMRDVGVTAKVGRVLPKINKLNEHGTEMKRAPVRKSRAKVGKQTILCKKFSPGLGSAMHK